MMTKKQEKIFALVMGIVVILGLVYFQDSNTLFNQAIDQFSPVDWDEIEERHIVKNSIPIILLEEIGDQCKVSSKKFNLIVDHEYFIHSDELVQKLNYDRENGTLLIACDLLLGEKSRLNVWYVVEESPIHAEKFEYFVTAWNEIEST